MTSGNEQLEDGNVSQTKSDLFVRYEKACDFNRGVDADKVSDSLRRFFKTLGVDVKVRQVGSFRAALDARAARDAWDAWDASLNSMIALGYEEIGEHEKLSGWLNYFEAFEAGLWVSFNLDDEVIWLPIPKLGKDDRNRCHADGKPALDLPDEKWYFWHGVYVPEEWGSIRSENWKPEWLLKEKNAERRRVLIQGLGYGRILKSLNAKKLDAWREYELYRISDSLDVEPIVLVSMRCPSTGLIHAHRVPPDMDSSRKAIAWVNHGIDAEEFVCET